MINILFRLQLPHLKCFIKTGRRTLFWQLSTNYKKSLLECQSKSLEFLSARPLSMTVGNVDKSTQSNDSKSTKNEKSIIYIGSLTHRVKGVKIFTCATSIIGIYCQSLMLKNILDGNNMFLNIAFFSVVGFFTFVSPCLIHMLTRKYVTEIWYNSTTDTYTATVLSLFLQKVNINFKLEDIKTPSSLSIFSNIYIKGKPVFINNESFLETEHCNKIMSYDKTVDFDLSNDKQSSNEHRNVEKL